MLKFVRGLVKFSVTIAASGGNTRIRFLGGLPLTNYAARL